jgi:hypothetical protein
MKLNKIVALSSLAAVVASSSLFAGTKSFKETVIKEEAKPAYSASLSAGWDSLYMFRGANVLRKADDSYGDSLATTALSLTWNLTESDSITFGAWTGFGLGSVDYQELDLPINYVHTIGDLSLGLGYTFYDNNLNNRNTYANELNVSAAYAIKLGDVTITPSTTYYFNLGPDNDEGSTNGAFDSGASYLDLRVSANIPLFANVSLAPYVAYGINFGMNSSDTNDHGNNAEFIGSNNVEYGLSVPVKINNVITISGYVSQSIAIQSLNGSGSGDTRECTTWGGAKVTFSF